MVNAINQSKFYMWRTLFALVHADNVVTDEEISFMAQALEDIDFTYDQTEALKDDALNAKDIEEMFNGITDYDDRMQFFSLARDVVVVDGNFCSDEQSVMTKLFKENIKQSNTDELVGKINLELEEDGNNETCHIIGEPEDKNNNDIKFIVSSFKYNFKKILEGNN